MDVLLGNHVRQREGGGSVEKVKGKQEWRYINGEKRTCSQSNSRSTSINSLLEAKGREGGGEGEGERSAVGPSQAKFHGDGDH
jgi:hypothetical protein